MRAISDAEYRMLVEEFNNNDDAAALGHCVHQLVEQSAQNNPDNTALICATTRLTYRSFNELANRLANRLVYRGVRPGDLVGVAMCRSAELVVALMAVLKTGAAYVPIDPAFPAKRIAQMLDDAVPSLIVSDARTLHALPGWQDNCLDIEETLEESTEGPDCPGDNLQIQVQPDDLAYVMYTSGSTGKPKGVEMSHGALSNLLLSLKKDPGCCEEDRMLAVTTVSFDMAFLELFLPLVCGATAIIAQSSDVFDPGVLVGLMEQHAINMMQGTPVAWQMLLDAGWTGQPRLRKMLSSGEALSRQLADRLLACGDNLWNLYGPTETTYASCWKVCAEERVVIGKPVANDQFYVLDNDMLPVAVGTPGELYIGGATLARGYRNDPELTRSRFLDNPFHQGRLHRTGDRATFLTPSKLCVLGRIGSLIKVRGNRIEPGDVEVAITEHWYVSQAVVVGRDDRLVAYCVRDAKVPVDEGTIGSVLSSLLRPWLAQRLPAYMVPTLFVQLESLPLTPNGKVDRRSLPDPNVSCQMPGLVTKPAMEMERQLVMIWSRILGRGHDRIAVGANFFHIGGDSLRVVELQTELRNLLGRTVPVTKLFEHYTIKALAAHLTSGQENVSKPIDSRRTATSTAMTPTMAKEDIAIVSLACRLPGGISTPEDFWKLLKRGDDATTSVPKDRWDADALYDADANSAGKSYCRQGGFLTSIDSFDASFFGISPREARSLEPSHHLALETCWEGFERAGYTMEQLRGSRTGVFIGTSSIPAHHRLQPVASEELFTLDGYVTTGSAAGTLSGRVSYALGLEGPAMTVDTACSSSLVTTHLACTALRQGECDMALSAGVSVLDNPGLYIEFSRLRGMSADGRCRAFAAGTQGTGWGEGCAVVVLKRLSDAQRDGDTIHAVLRSTAVNHGGRGGSLTTPSGPAQQRVIQAALEDAGLTPSDMDYIEAHGTGTTLGDHIEAAALVDVFGGSRLDGAEPLWLGSAKSNVGHTQAAAGLVGLLKVVLAMRHNTIPQTLHALVPTSAVDWESAQIALVQQAWPWLPTEHRLRRAGISAFGIGGTNAHAIVQEPPPAVKTSHVVQASAELPHTVPFVLSGNTSTALREQVLNLKEHVAGIDTTCRGRLGDIAYSLATTRSHFRRRLVLPVQGAADLAQKLESASTADLSTTSSAAAIEDEPRVAMLFTGQGSQDPGMGRKLYAAYPVFRSALDELAAGFQELTPPLLDVMWGDPGSSAAALLQRTDFAQPALFALEVALARLWQSWGVQPDFVIGHSVGELAAAHVAGVMDLSAACRLVAARGTLMQAVPRRGGMASLEASADEVSLAMETLHLVGEVDVASCNTPVQTVVSGGAAAVEAMVSHFAAQGRRAKTLQVSHAFHSHHMDDMLTAFKAVAKTVRFRTPTLAMVSSATGKLAGAGRLENPAYWVQQARSAVLFSDSIQTLADQGVNIFLELGPHPVLCGMGATCLADDKNSARNAWLPSLVHKKDDVSVIQDSLAELYVRRFPVNWSAYYAPFGCRRVELPTYAFQRQTFRPVRKPIASSGTAVRNRRGSVDQFKFEVKWSPVAVNNVHKSSSWGVLNAAGSNPLSEELSRACSLVGIKLLPISDIKEAKRLDGLLCLWQPSLDGDVPSQTRACVTYALALVQNFAKMAFAPPVVWLTRLAVGTGVDDADMRLGQSPLWGFIRTARMEHPELCLRLVDLSLVKETAPRAVAAALTMHSEPECAVRQARVLVPRLQHADPVLIKHKQPLLRTDGAVLITGGLGNLGSRVARWLVHVHGVRELVLTSRRGMESAGADALVDEISRLGVRVTVIACDVADFNAARSIFAMFSAGRPLRGVIHAAGAIDSGIVSAMTPQQCVAPFPPKIDGAWNLHQLTQNIDLDFFVMFSSISGVMGLPGLCNYAAANSFLDALAHTRRARGLAATSVAYGTWGGGGMADTLVDSTRAHLSHFGLDMLEPEDGLALLEEAACSGRALIMAAALRLEQHRVYLEERGSIPPMFWALLGKNGLPVPHDGDLRQVLSESDDQQRARIVLRMVQETAAKALGFAHPDNIHVDQSLQAIGMDSLTGVLFSNHLATKTGLKLSANVALVQPNLHALSLWLLAQMCLVPPETPSTSMSTSSGSGVETPATSASADSLRLDLAAIRKGVLDPSFTFSNATKGENSLVRPQSALVTGATGFVGAFVVHELLRQGIATHCLVRASSEAHARQRMVDTLDGFGLWDDEYEHLLSVVVGDLSQPLLGLAEETFLDLADGVDTICHSGALVDWMRPLEDYIGPNLVSTHEVLRMASNGRGKTVHLISTISTLSRHFGYDLTEESQEYGYGTSKYLAEKMISAARWRGANASVYRLPFVTASAGTGHFRLDRGDFLHNLIRGSLEVGAFPRLDGDLSAVLPVDYLANTIVSVMTQDLHRIGKDFDFVNAKAPTFDDFFNMLGAASNGDKEILPFSQWRQRAIEYAAVDLKCSIARIIPILDGYTDDTTTAMIKALPAGDHVFGASVYPAPPVDEQFVRRYLGRIEAARAKHTNTRS